MERRIKLNSVYIGKLSGHQIRLIIRALKKYDIKKKRSVEVVKQGIIENLIYDFKLVG